MRLAAPLRDSCSHSNAIFIWCIVCIVVWYFIMWSNVMDVLLCDVLPWDVLLCDLLLSDVFLYDILICDVWVWDILLCDVFFRYVLICDVFFLWSNVLWCVVLLCDVFLYDVLLREVSYVMYGCMRILYMIDRRIYRFIILFFHNMEDCILILVDNLF